MIHSRDQTNAQATPILPRNALRECEGLFGQSIRNYHDLGFGQAMVEKTASRSLGITKDPCAKPKRCKERSPSYRSQQISEVSLTPNHHWNASPSRHWNQHQIRIEVERMGHRNGSFAKIVRKGASRPLSSEGQKATPNIEFGDIFNSFQKGTTAAHASKVKIEGPVAQRFGH
jgi:hypothetical protein